MTNVVSDGTKTMGDSADNARYAQRQDDPQKSLQVVCSQIPGCRYDVPVDLGKYIVDRQHHKRQEIVYHAENDRKRCVDQRKLRKMEKAQNHIDDTVFFQQILPCECPQQKIHPHGKNEDQYNETGLIDIFFRTGSWQAGKQGSGR